MQVPRAVELALSGYWLVVAILAGCISAYCLLRTSALRVGLSLARKLLRPSTAADAEIEAYAEGQRRVVLSTGNSLGGLCMVCPMALAISAASYFTIFGTDAGIYALYVALGLAPALVLQLHLFRTYPTSFDFYPATCFVVMGLVAGFATSVDAFYFVSMYAAVIQVMAAFVSRPRHFLPLSAAHLGWRLWICSAPGLQESYVRSAFLSIIVEALNVVVCFAGHSALWSMGRAMFEAARNGAVVRAFVAAQCDALVVLGPDQCLVEASPRLAAILQENAKVTATKGASFRDYLAPDEVERFLAFVSIDTSNLKVAPQLLTTLQSRAGQKVPVQILQMGLDDGGQTQVKRCLGIVCTKAGEPLSQRVLTPDAETGQIVDMREDPPVQRLPEAQEAGEEAAPEESSSVDTACPFEAEGVEPWGGSGDRAVLRVRTRLVWEVVEESDSCSSHFNLKDKTLAEFLSQCKKPHAMLRWLTVAHLLTVVGQKNPNAVFPDAKVFAPGDNVEYEAELHVETVPRDRAFPEEEDEVDIDRIRFDPELSYVDMTLKFVPLEPAAESSEEPARFAGFDPVLLSL